MVPFLFSYSLNIGTILGVDTFSDELSLKVHTFPDEYLPMIILFPMNNQEKTTFLSIKYKKTLMTNWGYKKTK